MGLHRLRTRITVLCRVLDRAAFDSDAGKHFYVMTKGAHASLGSRFGLRTSSKLQVHPHTGPKAECRTRANELRTYNIYTL